MVKHFVQLKSLRILDCKMIEEVIFFKEGLTEEERMSKILFPQLEDLSLEDLPKLTRFCYETQNEFPLLESLNLKSCPEMMAFISKSVIGDVGDNLEVDNSALFNEKVISSFLCGFFFLSSINFTLTLCTVLFPIFEMCYFLIYFVSYLQQLTQ